MSPVTLKVDHPDFPDDYEFGVSELGRVKNHGTLEVDDDAVKTFETSRGMSIEEAFHGNGVVHVEGAPEYTPSKQEQETPTEETLTEQTTPTEQTADTTEAGEQ